MPRLLIVATVVFLVGLALIVGGMLGIVPRAAAYVGSVCAVLAVLLRIVGRLK